VLGIVKHLHLGPLQHAGEIYVGLLAATILFIATNAGIIGVSRLVYSMGLHRQVPDRLRQLLVILVDNALRHGEPGGTVEVRSAKVGLDLRLEVSDRGPGIPAEQRSKVFEPFHQLDGSRSGSGTGLGLAIARWIVSAHGGTIKLADNEPGLAVRMLLPLRGLIEDSNGSPTRLGSSLKKAIRKPKPSSTT